ncbi:DNA primase family protein [Primorskyibacter sp. S87]|uniref:DNA primase family protein n=1 Tax=Primorskyibacter sp. S87 TaxID=3415126 RepID=UPI003C7AF8B6
MLSDDDKRRIEEVLDQAAELDTEAERVTLLGALIVELNEPPGLTVARLEKDLQRRFRTRALGALQRDIEFNRIARTDRDEWPDEIAALRPLLGPGWTIAKIEAQVQKRVPPMSMDEVDEVCVTIAKSDEAERSGMIAALKRQAKARNLELETKVLRTKVERAVSHLIGESFDGNGVMIVPGDHRANASTFLDEAFTHEDGTTIRYTFGCWYIWIGPKWQVVGEEVVSRRLRQWAEQKATLDENQVPVPFKPNLRFVAETLDAIRAAVAWDIEEIDGVVWEGKSPFAGPMISVRNGILNIRTGKLYDHTPRLFNVTAVNAEWHGTGNVGASAWGKFIKSITPADPSQIELVQEFLGYSLTQDTHMQKGLMLIGPKRSGKGTILRTAGKLLGAGSVHSIPTEQFGKSFPLMGAEKAAIISLPDIRTDKETRFGPVAETILTAIGEDTATIQRKHLPPWIGRLTAKWWGMANSVPRLRDNDGVLATRFLFCQLETSFFGKEDTDLMERIEGDLDSVLVWAVQGLRRLHKNGHFTETSRGSKMAEKARVRQDPIGAFVEEYLTFSPSHHEAKDALFAAFFLWAERQGMTGWSKAGFFKELMEKEFDGVLPGSSGKYPNRLLVLKGVRFQDGMQPGWRDIAEVRDRIRDDQAMTEEAVNRLIKLYRSKAEREDDEKVVEMPERGAPDPCSLGPKTPMNEDEESG